MEVFTCKIPRGILQWIVQAQGILGGILGGILWGIFWGILQLVYNYVESLQIRPKDGPTGSSDYQGLVSGCLFICLFKPLFSPECCGEP